MSDAIIVLNAGSSSIKFSVFSVEGRALELVCRGQAEGLYTEARFTAKDLSGTVMDDTRWPEGESLGHDGALDHLVEFLGKHTSELKPLAIGHRVVHGGTEFTHPELLNAGVVKHLETLVPLAPLHQPHNLSPIRLLFERTPDLPQVACFDTAFHAEQPELAQWFALPRHYTDEGIRRYGFHGLSYEYIASVLPDHDRSAADGHAVVMHLGNGASMCAMNAGHSVASTMGFTAVEGLPMGTRCGSMDPGVVLYLIEQKGMTLREVERLIYKESGMLGLSGLSSDMRVLQESDDPAAAFAIEYYVYRIGRELGSMAAALGGLDSIVFTAGIGENAAAIRASVCQNAAWLGVELDAAANASGKPGLISTPESEVSVWVIPTNEELMIARHTLNLVAK
ncbi:MAG: acetate/propionate family kinase [Gammaproteobacteria bacterium]|nr:acetate/propionate family kinase [Gammaproteobacteria bacterium]